MLTALIRALTSRYAGPLACVAIMVLGMLLATTSISAAGTEARLRARIAVLTEDARTAGGYWRARYAVCEAKGPQLRAGLSRTAAAEAPAETRLLRSPEGYDVCARMENADQAVLATLR